MTEKKKGKVLNFLDREAILGMDDLKSEDVYVPQWNGTIRIAAMTAKARDEWETAIVSDQEAGAKPNIRARLVVMCAQDEDGKLLFSMDDAEAIGAKSAAAVDVLFSVAQRLCGLRTGEVEEMEKNS